MRIAIRLGSLRSSLFSCYDAVTFIYAKYAQLNAVIYAQHFIILWFYVLHLQNKEN
jgi:hypothetical protein